jgi:hypothetical protein
VMKCVELIYWKADFEEARGNGAMARLVLE